MMELPTGTHSPFVLSNSEALHTHSHLKPWPLVRDSTLMQQAFPCFSLSLTTVLLFSPLASVHGQTPDSPSPWDHSGAAGISLATGNADNLGYTLNLLSVYEHDGNTAKLGADWHYAENNGVKNTDSFRAFGKYQVEHDERLHFGGKTSYLVDNISDINYRIDLGLFAGYYLLKNKHQSLSLEAGPGYAWQDQDGILDHYATLSFGIQYEYHLSSHSKLWLSTSYTPAIEDFSDYLLSSEAGIDIALNDHWALRSALRHHYDSTPANDKEPNDILVTIGLRYSLLGYPDEKAGHHKISEPANIGSGSIKAGWSSSLAMTASMAEGNSDSLDIGISYDTAYRETDREFFFTTDYNYSESDGLASNDSLRARAQFNKLLTRETYLGLGSGFLRDDIADTDYRVTPAITLGHYIIKEKDMTLSLETGPGYTFEKTGGITEDYFTMLAAEKFVWEINDRISFKQHLSGHLNPSETDDYNLMADILLDTHITKHISWRLAASWTYDNSPAAGKEKDDFTLSSGIALKF